MRNLGIVLMVFGFIMMLITGFNIISEKEIVDLGRLEINKKESTPVSWSPIIGGILLVAGLLLFFISKKRVA